MIWPQPLSPPDPQLGQQSRALAQQLSKLPQRAAATWARLLECNLEIEVEPWGAQDPLRSRGLLKAMAAWVLPDGGRGLLELDVQLLAGSVAALAGLRRSSMGPLPLSPAEEGLFAFLCLSWFALIDPAPRLEWIHGGDPDWPQIRPQGVSLTWRVALMGQLGAARWWLPPEPIQPAPLGCVPIPLSIGAQIRLGQLPERGDLVPLRSGLFLNPLELPLRLYEGRIEVSEMKHWRLPEMEALPVQLSLELAQFQLSAAEVAALQPGALLPLELPDPPEVRLKVGDVVIAQGILVDDEGRLALQICRSDLGSLL